MFWIIFAYIILLTSNVNDNNNNLNFSVNSGHFPEEYNIIEAKYYDKILTVFYFSFTTLTTIGFGDLHP